MMIVGPTGAGKSVLLALIALQFRRYLDSQIYIFDKGCSARAAVLAMGGAHHALGLGDAAQGADNSQGRPSDGEGSVEGGHADDRSEEHTSELQSLMRISYAAFCLKTKKKYNN